MLFTHTHTHTVLDVMDDKHEDHNLLDLVADEIELPVASSK